LAVTAREEGAAASRTTTVMALVPPDGPIALRWTRLPPEFAPGSGFLFSTIAATSEIEARPERETAAISGRVTQASVRRVRVALPDGFSLLSIEGEAVLSTQSGPDGSLEVELLGPKESFEFRARLERARPDGEGEVTLRAPSIVGATREVV